MNRVKKKIIIDLNNIPKLTNDIYLPLYTNKNRYLILYGGAGSGKSVFAAQKIIFRMLAEPGHKFLVVRKVAKTLRQSTFSLLRQTIIDWGMNDLFKINKSDMEIICTLNNNSIIHAGLDDVEKIKSVHGVTGLWIEEASELLQEDLQQLDLRLRGHTNHYKQIIISFNPISITHWLKTYFFDSNRPDTKIVHSTYKDNKYLDSNYINVLMQLKQSDPYYFGVYALGEWGILGKTIFDSKIVTERLRAIKNKLPLKRGQFVFDYKGQMIVDDTIKWEDAPDGVITIYEDVKEGYPYVLGADTAGEGSDKYAAHVINNITSNQAAVFHNEVDADLFARQMYCLGKYYNTALISIEANFDMYPIRELDRLKYPKQYYRETVDSITDKIITKLGFRTDKITRPVIISNLVKIVREHPELFNHVETLEEMLTFVRNEQGRPEAAEGKHDDLIMSLAIAHYTRPQQTMEVKKQVDKVTGYYTESELEDMGYKKSEIKKIMEGMKPWK